MAYNQFFIDLNRLNVKKYTNKFVAATLASLERGGGIPSRKWRNDGGVSGRRTKLEFFNVLAQEVK